MPKKKIYTVATSHLDTVWSWDFETTVSQYIYNTLVDNFKLFEKYPSYKFSFEGSYRYELMEEYYPELFDKMKDYIAKGRWNVCGSAFENGDTNIPSPEALFRNILFGNSYFDEKFGKRSVDIYLPDCFGFGWALPAIERHSNLMGFTTQKLAWGSAYGIPFDIGKWQGVDGSEVYASINPHDYYYTLTKLRDWDFVLNKFKENEKYDLNDTYIFHGIGDRGGAPDEKSVAFVEEEIKKNDAEFAARPEFEAIKWAAAKNAPIYRTCYTDILRVAFTYKFKRGKLADLVSLLSGRDFETREFKIEIEERSFNQLHEAVLQAVNQTNYERYLMIVRSAGIVKKSLIRSQNVLNFGYALFLALRERKVDSNQIEKIVRKWLALSILTGRYSSGSPESAFDYDIKRFFAYDDPTQYLNITEAGELSEAYWKVNLVQRLNTSVASSPFFNMFLVAQVKAHDKGFLSMEIDIESMLENRGDIHHLFPKNYLIKNGIVQAQYNQIANYAFIQQEINIKIKDSSPAHYMTEVIGQCNTKKPVYGGIIEQDRLAENLKQNCIPDGFESMEIGDYQDFLQRRRELMAEKIHQYYDSL